MVKFFRFFVFFINFLILDGSRVFCNEINGNSQGVDNIKQMFSSQSIGEFFVYPHLIKDYSLSGISIVEFSVAVDGTINDIEILKSLGQPFDDAIFDGLNTFAADKINQSYIAEGFRYRLPIFFKN